MTETRDQKEKQKEEAEAYNAQNMKLLQVEEKQFREYASKVIREAEERGPHTKPLRKAAQAGAGILINPFYFNWDTN